MTGHRVFHLAAATRWAEAQRAGEPYAPDDFAAEGFVHCSAAEQVVATANLYYRGRQDLVLLEIDVAALGDALVWEPGTGERAELFPHVYTPIDPRAVVSSRAIEPDADGRFTDLA